MEAKKLIFSGSCFFCLAKTDYVWCKSCEHDFIRANLRCRFCARISTHEICGNCVKQPPLFITTQILFSYQYPANHLIKAFKFNNRPELAQCFAEKLADKLMRRDTSLPEIIVPVPLHRIRQRGRGYNQSLEIARHLSKRLGLKLNAALCNRTINTYPQSSLPRKTRRKNIKGAFSLNVDQIPSHIAIVDDVITTGSTINELARLFKKAGCKRIEAWAIART